MKFGILIAHKKKSFLPKSDQLLRKICSKASPIHCYEQSEYSSLSEDASFFYFFSSNETNSLGVKVDSPLKPSFINFYYGDVDESKKPVLNDYTNLHQEINSMSGRFSFIGINNENNSFSAATTLNRVEPIYKIEALSLNGLNRGHRFLLFSIYSALIACSPSFQQGVYHNTSIGIDALTH